MFIRKHNISKKILTEFKPSRFYSAAFSFPSTNGHKNANMSVENLVPLSQSYQISYPLRRWSSRQTPLQKTRETHLFSPNNKTFLTTSVNVSSMLKQRNNVFIQSLQFLKHLLLFQKKQNTKTITSLLLDLTIPFYWSNLVTKTQETNFCLFEKSIDRVHYWKKPFTNLIPIRS